MATGRDLQQNRSVPAPRTAVPRNRGESKNKKARRRSTIGTATKSGSAWPRNLRRNPNPPSCAQRVWESNSFRTELSASGLVLLTLFTCYVLVSYGWIELRFQPWSRDQVLYLGIFLYTSVSLTEGCPFARAMLKLLMALCLTTAALANA